MLLLPLKLRWFVLWVLLVVRFNQPGRKLVSQADQAMIPRASVPRSRFSGSATVKTTFDAGLIYPIFVDEILPGDHMRYTVVPFVRMATPVFPMMDNLRVDIHAFFVPNRLTWENWEEFLGALEPSQFLEGYGSQHVVPRLVINPPDDV